MVLWIVSILSTSRRILASQIPGDFRIILDSLFSLLPHMLSLSFARSLRATLYYRSCFCLFCFVPDVKEIRILTLVGPTFQSPIWFEFCQ